MHAGLDHSHFTNSISFMGNIPVAEEGEKVGGAQMIWRVGHHVYRAVVGTHAHAMCKSESWVGSGPSSYFCGHVLKVIVL